VRCTIKISLKNLVRPKDNQRISEDAGKSPEDLLQDLPLPWKKYTLEDVQIFSAASGIHTQKISL